MPVKIIIWFWNRYRPVGGWLLFFLLAAVIACLVTAVIEVEWVPETAVVIPAAFWGLMMGIVLAQRPLRPLAAWSFITLYGLLLPTLWLGKLVPPLWRWFAGWQPFSQYLRQNSALLFDRMASWFRAVINGGSSKETIMFAFGLGIAAWFLTAITSWNIYRQQKALPAMLLMGIALAANGYFGQANLLWLILFVGLSAGLIALNHLNSLERTWTQNHVDYSDQIRLDFYVHAGAIGLILFALSAALPGLNMNKLALAFQNQPAVQQAEQTLERLFAGVRQPRRPVPAPDGAGGSGLLPRAYLLGNPPELSETVVMTAVVTLPNDLPQTALSGHHWRALSYNVYTGQGWALSEERQEELAANTPIELPPDAAQLEIQQTVHWVLDDRIARYSLGFPRQFDQAVTVSWRGLTDLSRVQRVSGETEQYYLLSQISAATPEQLRQTGIGETFNAQIPPVILARYTQLPDSLPQRVQELAEEVGGSQPTAYDQAHALELFLRQYPYSLDVELPPKGTDPVDFFLFDLQKGYCDYYASTMAVMARSLGLPARIATGYLVQPADANGMQTIYEINGHSWAEVYFPEYGWIEFEPTAAFPSPQDNILLSTAVPNPEPTNPPPAIPPPAPQEPVWLQLWRGWRWILLAMAFGIGCWLWQRWQKQLAGRDSVIWAYGRLQHHAAKLDIPLYPSQTPDEFTAVFLASINRYANKPRLQPLIERIRPHIETLNTLFIRRRYGQKTDTGMVTALKSWQRIRRPLWLLRFIQKILP
ncbi:MAG: transglutaminase domain-containing protein [Ardenticatenaceae bacterium]|nr:transglutaminase domain-containing protein [Ardenticatenaceae bacterium]MCB9446468.1 transglutaminase domain-containing protein [Ardenticatenaceae bacterium]